VRKYELSDVTSQIYHDGGIIKKEEQDSFTANIEKSKEESQKHHHYSKNTKRLSGDFIDPKTGIEYDEEGYERRLN